MSKDSDNIKKEKSLLLILSSIQFFNILDFVIIMPLAPMLMREYNIGPGEFAFLASSYSIASGLIGLVYSTFAEKYDRKDFLLLTLIGFIVATFLCALAPTYQLLLIARIAAGVFGGIITPSSYAIISDLIPSSRRGRAMGTLLGTFSVTSIIGIPIGLSIADTLGWRYTFVFVSIGAALVSIVSKYLLPSVPVEGGEIRYRKIFKTMLEVLIAKEHRAAFIVIALSSASGFLLFPFLAAYCVKNIGLMESDLKYIYLIGGLLTVVTSRKCGKLTDKIGALRVFFPVTLLSFPMIYLYTTVENMSLAPFLIISTLFMATLNGRFVPIMTLVTKVPGPLIRGTFMGIMSSMRAFAAGIASAFAGLVITVDTAGKLENFNHMGYLSIFAMVVASYFVMKIYYQVEVEHE